MPHIITGLEIQKRNSERVNVFLDGEFGFSLSLMEAAKLKKGQALSEAEVEALRGEDAVLKAVDSAVRFLAHRPRSLHEVRQNLARKGTPQAVIEAALSRLSAMGYLDDVAFARFWVEDRNRFRPRGPRALRFELRQKGVESAVIDEVLTDTLDVEEAAYRAAYDHARRFTRVSRQEFRAKVSGFLQRRGFSYATTREIVERLLDELQIEAASDDD